MTSDLGLISPTFYKQLLLVLIPKVLKDTDTVIFALVGSACVKATCKMLVTKTPSFNPPSFRQHRVDNNEAVMMGAEPVVGKYCVWFFHFRRVLEDVNCDAVTS